MLSREGQECDMDVVMKRFRVRGVLAGAILASGMTALAAPPKERAAILLPPVKMEPGEMPTLARGAIDDLPTAPMTSTPVARRKGSSDAPAWLSGVDPNVVTAAGASTGREKLESKAPFFGSAKDLPPLTSPKLSTSESAKPAPPQPQDKPRLLPQVPPLVGQPEPVGDPNMPFRGTASNGAPVMAGPPAYRWYGYGASTPGANQYAPAGQYPKGSANWYGVTGATPGAFPVPVVNPYRSEPGNEPPTYVTNPPPRATMPATAVGVRSNPGVSPRPDSQPVGVPAMPPVTNYGAGTGSRTLPPLPSPVGIPTMPVSTTAPGGRITGSPVTATKPAPHSPAIAADPNFTPTPMPVLPPPNLFNEPGAKLVQNEIIARGQMPDAQRDPAVELIQGLCRGRADGVDVRWSGSRKLTVCFEVKTQADAGRLVKDLSARPELAPFAIDFCALVK
jgi:hypothetical protein